MTGVGEKNPCIYDDGIQRRVVHDYHWKGWKDEDGGDCGDTMQNYTLSSLIVILLHSCRVLFLFSSY
jgi:hypothetical protein